MCFCGTLLWQKGLIGATQGNLSCRLDEKHLLTTPAGVSKGHMSPEQIVKVDIEGYPLNGGTPSSELKLHLRVYQVRHDCMAAVHAHPPTATAIATLGELLPDSLSIESAYVLGSVKTLPFAMPGGEEAPDTLEPFLMDHKAFLLGNHGAFVLGKDLMDATWRMETLERISVIWQTVRTVGTPQELPPRALNYIRDNLLNGRL